MAGVWKRDGTIAVTKGSKKVVGTGTTFADPKNAAAKGHLLVMVTGTAVDLYEVDYSESNSVFYLIEAYRGDTGTGKAYAIDTSRTDSIPEFARRLNATLSAYQQQSDAFQALLTSNAATIEVTAPDGTKQTLIPWKRVTSEGEGQAARAKLEADKAAASAALAGDIVAASALPLPDVWAPLSDGLRLITGYGREVLIGSDVVARMVDFARSTTATYIGKDGLLKTAAVNEPRFEKDGLLIEGQSTNLVPRSEDLLQWSKNGDVTRERQAGVYTKITAPGGTMGCYLAGVPLVVGKTYTISFWGYADVVMATKIGSERESAGWIGSLTTTPTRYSKTFTATQEVGTIVAYTGQGVSGSFYVGGFQLEELPFASSYIPTSGAAVTRAHDVVTIPWALNVLPTSLTVALNYDVAGIGPTNQRLIEYAAPTIPRYLMQITQVGDFESYCATQALKVVGPSIGPGSLAVAATSPTRHAVKLTGKAIATATPGGPVGATSVIRIGSGQAGASPIYGHIRNLRIWHKTLSDDQLKAVA